MEGRLDVGRVIEKVWRIYVDQAPILMPAAAAVFVFSGLLSSLLLRDGAGLALLGELIRFVATFVFTGMVVELVADVQDGRRDGTPGQLLRAVLPVLGSLLLVSIVAGILVAVGFFLILVPGLILMTIWFVAAPVVVLERPPGLGALSRSRDLVRGNGWQVFGVIVIVFVLVLIVSVILEVVGNSASTAVGIVVGVIIGVLTAPLSALAQSVLYFELLSVRGEARGTTPAASPDPFGAS
jgi:hypothetical protein